MEAKQTRPVTLQNQSLALDTLSFVLHLPQVGKALPSQQRALPGMPSGSTAMRTVEQVSSGPCLLPAPSAQLCPDRDRLQAQGVPVVSKGIQERPHTNGAPLKPCTRPPHEADVPWGALLGLEVQKRVLFLLRYNHVKSPWLTVSNLISKRKTPSTCTFLS